MIAFRNELLEGQFIRTIGHGIYGGADLGECLATARRIRPDDRESWRTEWTALAEQTLTAARASSRRGHDESARTAFLRASNYYRTAYVLHLEAPLPAVVSDLHKHHRSAFSRAAEIMGAKSLSIPFERTTLPGWFFSGGAGRRPIVISIGGYDSTAEESFFWNAAAATARGWHCVTFDGPGQGEPLITRSMSFRPDWEKVVSAVIDAVATRPDVDASRIVLIGESWGGYLAPRAAAFDPRVAACVLDPAQVGLFRAMLARLPIGASLRSQLPDGPAWLVGILRRLLARTSKRLFAGWALRRGMLTHGVATPWDYVVDARRYEQGDVIAAIRCPTLVCDASDDPISAFAGEFFEKLTCEKTLLQFTARDGASDHCVCSGRGRYHARIFDWIEDHVSHALEPVLAHAS